jgi:hypothetical protein
MTKMKTKNKNQEERFEKVVKYFYPDETKIGEEIIAILPWYLLGFVVYVITSPVWSIFFFFKNHGFTRKVYWRKLK